MSDVREFAENFEQSRPGVVYAPTWGSPVFRAAWLANETERARQAGIAVLDPTPEIAVLVGDETARRFVEAAHLKAWPAGCRDVAACHVCAPRFGEVSSAPATSARLAAVALVFGAVAFALGFVWLAVAARWHR